MAWRILRTTDDALDDPDWVQLGTQPAGILIQAADLRRSAQGRFAVLTAWVDGLGTEVAGYGAVTMQLVTVIDVPTSPTVGSTPLVSIGPSAVLSQPPVATARTPAFFDAPMTGPGEITIRASGMTPPLGATRLRFFVETIDA